MKRRFQTFLSNFLKNRLDRILSDLPILQVTTDRINVHVKERLAGINVDAIIADRAARTIEDNCDLDSAVSDALGCISWCDHIDYGQFASEIDYSDLHDQLDYDQLGGEIDYDDLGGHIDYDDLGNHIDRSDLAERIKDSVTVNVSFD